MYADCVLAGNADLLVVMRTDGDVNRVVLVLNLSERNIAADGNAGVHLNAGGQDEVDIRIQLVLRQTIIRNAVAQHAAELGTLVIDYDLVTHQRQEIRRRQTARSAADDADALAGRRCGSRRRGVVRVVAREALDAADVDRIVHHAAAAVCLARVLADIAAYGREGIVLADQAHGVVVAAGTHECNVARNIHTGRAQCYTRHRMIPAEQTAAALHMGEVVIAEALHALQNHAGSLIADGAVRRILNNTGGFLDQVNGLRCCGGIQHLLEQSGQLPQTDAARNTFAAGLCMAQTQERQRHIHRAQTRRTGADAPLDIAVQAGNDGLSLARRFNG